MKRFALSLLASVLVCLLSPPTNAAEPESSRGPFTVELGPNGTPTAMQPKSEATEKLFES